MLQNSRENATISSLLSRGGFSVLVGIMGNLKPNYGKISKICDTISIMFEISQGEIFALFRRVGRFLPLIR